MIKTKSMVNQKEILPAKKRLKLIRKFSDKQLLAFYKRGFTDREMAEEFGCSFSCVRMRRCKLGLVAKTSGVSGNHIESPTELKETYKKHNSKVGRKNLKEYNRIYHKKYQQSKHGKAKKNESKRKWREKRRELGLPVS